MEFSIDRKKISKALSLVQGITNRKTSFSSSSDVLIKAMGQKVTIVADNLETIFHGVYDANVELEGTVAINSKNLYKILNNDRSAVVSIKEASEESIEIETGNRTHHIASSCHEIFPGQKTIKDIPLAEVDAKAFRRMIDVATAISPNRGDTREWIIGVLFEKIVDDSGQKLRMVSTDGMRLNCFDLPFDGELEFPEDPEENVIIPKKGLEETKRFIGKKGKIYIGLSVAYLRYYLIVQKDDETIMVRLLEDGYPNYRRLLSTDGLTAIEIDRQILLTAMNSIPTQSSDVRLNFLEGNLIITITDPEIGESKEEITIGYSGPDIEIIFNAKNFIAALKPMVGDSIVVSLKDGRHPCIIRSKDNDPLVCVITPKV